MHTYDNMQYVHISPYLLNKTPAILDKYWLQGFSTIIKVAEYRSVWNFVLRSSINYPLVDNIAQVEMYANVILLNLVKMLCRCP